MTYQDLYLQHLETTLNQGGKLAEIDATIAEFNMPTAEKFQKWIAGVACVLCSTCGDVFKPENPKPDQEILCKSHASPATSP